MPYPQYNYPAFGGYNPVTPYVPRSEPVQAFQQPSAPIQQQGNINTQGMFYCRPVASKEEAMGVPVDFMGNPMFFTDLAHGVIYMKRFNTGTGSADIFEFKLHGQDGENTEVPVTQSVEFAPLSDVMDMKNAITKLRADVDKLKKPKTSKRITEDDDDDE